MTTNLENMENLENLGNLKTVKMSGETQGNLNFCMKKPGKYRENEKYVT